MHHRQRTIGNDANLAGKGENPTTYTGARLALAYRIDADWDVLITESFSNLDAQGLSVEYPYSSELSSTGALVPLKPLQNTMFSPSFDKDHYENTGWTLNGKIGPIKMIYTGSYLDRHVDQQVDYTNYTRTGSGVYYTCAGGNTGWGSGKAVCYNPVTAWQDTVHNTHLSNEIRFSSPDDWRLRFLSGAFNEDFKIYDVMNFNYRTIPSCGAAGSPTLTAALDPAGGWGNALIGRELYPLLVSAGYTDVQVSPRMVYVDASRPACRWVHPPDLHRDGRRGQKDRHRAGHDDQRRMGAGDRRPGTHLRTGRRLLLYVLQGDRNRSRVDPGT